MRKALRFALFLACCLLSAVWSEAQVTANVLTRVLMIRVGQYQGSAFTMEVDGRQYLVTAKHMVKRLKAEDSIEILNDGQSSSVSVEVFRRDDPVDIAVLVPPAQLHPCVRAGTFHGWAPVWPRRILSWISIWSRDFCQKFARVVRHRSHQKGDFFVYERRRWCHGDSA